MDKSFFLGRERKGQYLRWDIIKTFLIKELAYQTQAVSNAIQCRWMCFILPSHE